MPGIVSTHESPIGDAVLAPNRSADAGVRRAAWAFESGTEVKEGRRGRRGDGDAYSQPELVLVHSALLWL